MKAGHVVLTGVILLLLVPLSALAGDMPPPGARSPMNTEIRDTVKLGSEGCTITIVGGAITMCEGIPATASADLTCGAGFVPIVPPEWFVDGDPIGKGLTVDIPPLSAGAYALRASCGSCVDDVPITVLPIGECAFQPDLVVAYAGTATENTTGVFVPPNIAPVNPDNFAELKFLMRPVALVAEPPVTAAGQVVLAATAANLEVYRTDGTAVPLPAAFEVTSLPVTLYVNGTGMGEARLVASFDLGMTYPDSVLFRVGPFPGLAGEAVAAYPDFQWVRVIQTDDRVQAAIDPARHAERIGLPYRAYVVEHQTPTQWAADNALTDVSGGFEAGTVTAGSVAANIVDVWTTGLAGGTVGIGYDVVYDFGLDGTLDPGDLVDGLNYEEAGVYVMPDIAAPGPHPVTEIIYSGGSWLGQDTYYPTDIGTMGELPLVVISHGNGHNYQWYDYLGNHLASHGYVVMSHTNNTGPGIESASTTTITNTDYFLGNLASIGGGVLAGHVDGHNITWIGHSRGGEGVTRAYDRVFDGEYVPAEFTRDDVIAISSIAPTVYLATTSSNPHDRNYHLLWGAADGDVSGSPSGSSRQCFRIPENVDTAIGNVQITYVHGADHNDFNCCGFDDYDGPPELEIGRERAQNLAQGYYLALVELYNKGNIAMKDYFARMYDDLHPIGIDDTFPVIAVHQYWDGVAAANDVIDDYQAHPDLAVSSSGGAVTFDVSNPFEGELDGDDDFCWTGDAMNGMTMSELAPDNSDGVVFDWTVGQQKFYEFEVVPAMHDFSDDLYLSFRACQGTNHPETLALDGPLTFTATLRDGSGTTSSILFANYGSITRPFQRNPGTECPGWQNEFATVRLRLSDFEIGGSGIDLTDIHAVRLEFGSASGSERGRIGLDRVELTGD